MSPEPGGSYRKTVAALTGQAKVKQNLHDFPVSPGSPDSIYSQPILIIATQVEDNPNMSPGKSAIMSAVGVVLMAYLIFSASESPSTALATLQYILLAAGLVGLIGSLAKIGRRPET